MRIQLLLAFVLICASSVAHGAPCPDDGTPVGMKQFVSRLQPRWFNFPNPADPDQRFGEFYGISNLFAVGVSSPDGVALGGYDNQCNGCHGAVGFPAYNAYQQCGSCHNANPGKYPSSLDFTKIENLRATSYYLPGKTKAEASLARVLDGTMPPAKHPPGWCDEIIAVYKAWLALGMPL